MATLFSELKRRNVFRTGAAYAVAAWLVVEVSGVLLDVYGAPGWVLKVLVGLLFLGFPLVLGFSWAFELTPEGLRRETEIAQDHPGSQRTARRLDVITIALLLAAGGFLVYDRLLVKPAQVTTAVPIPAEIAAPGDIAPTPAIAVLPFADMSPEQDQEYFSDGMAEELLNLLAKVPGLKVAARTSSFRFKDPDHDITEIAQTLGVNHVLEGSVRKAGNRIRVTAQLIDARDGFHVWSESYDQELEDVLNVQDQISQQIVAALSGHLGVSLDQAGPGTTRPVDPTAYEAFLKGNHAKHQRTPESILLAVSYYETAVAAAPEFAPAWGGLARAANLAEEMFPDRFSEFDTQYRDAVEKALALDPDEPQALAMHATTRFDLRSEFAPGLTEFERVIEIEPSDTEAMSWLAQRYRLVGDVGRAEELNRRAYALDPLSPRVILGIARTLAMTGQYDEARRIAERAMVELKGHQYVVMAMLDILRLSGQLDDANQWLERLAPDPATTRLQYRMNLAAALGDRAQLLRLVQQAQQEFQEVPLAVNLITFEGHWLAGEHDLALAALGEARKQGFEAIAWYQMRPALWQSLSEPARRSTVNLMPLIQDFPEVVAGYAGLGVDIVAEAEAAGLTPP